MATSDKISPDEIRALFANSLSEMYRKEVPQYDKLLELVSDINHQRNSTKGCTEDSIRRIECERHGAIRLGTAEELSTMRRLFCLMGMHPVGYYDLTVAGVPVHATGFRPLEENSLQYNPFRVFTSLLRLDLIEDSSLQKKAGRILSQRKIFTPRCLELIEEMEKLPEVPKRNGVELIHEALKTFQWHETSTVDVETYKELKASHSLLADVICFRGPHINHLTPRVLDIDAAQAAMSTYGLNAKPSIEGPPPRQNDILLRQASFLALEEPINFLGGSLVTGKHRARFGEIEQRGMALSPKGRQIYDELLDRFHMALSRLPPSSTEESKSALLKACFEKFPDDVETIRRQKLAFFRYEVISGSNQPLHVDDITALVDSGFVKSTPITYEDFLPASAAGIFRSNLYDDRAHIQFGIPDKKGFEMALGCSVNNEFQVYSKIEQSSIERCLKFFAVN